MNRVRCSFLLLTLAACQGRGPAPTVREPVGSPVAMAPTDTVLQIERSVCFGFCPTYVASVTASGQGHISGTHRAAGFERDITVDTTAVAALLRRFDTEGYFQLDSAYTPGHPLCDVYATDNPGAILFARLGSRSLRVQHYHGCLGPKGTTPDQPLAAPLLLLTSLEAAVDSLLRIAEVVDSLRGR